MRQVLSQVDFISYSEVTLKLMGFTISKQMTIRIVKFSIFNEMNSSKLSNKLSSFEAGD